ncbi:hypothetical protein Nepgr_022490 [Nepenthes gracilis]|uniref:Secreted peptide n=1 Tax=Nepenthes gracilis TaxID=150966 RepID=A0AAD3T0V3_NEPGR|nr:hypothetical protein Nepgr_022490 [Nepenthes gracilis]
MVIVGLTLLVVVAAAAAATSINPMVVGKSMVDVVVVGRCMVALVGSNILLGNSMVVAADSNISVVVAVGTCTMVEVATTFSPR